MGLKFVIAYASIPLFQIICFALMTRYMILQRKTEQTNLKLEYKDKIIKLGRIIELLAIVLIVVAIFVIVVSQTENKTILLF